MTREEHIIYMKNLRTDLKLKKIFSDETMVSLDMAIKALEQGPRKGHWIGIYQVDFGEWQEYDVKLSDGFVTDNCHCSECGEELSSGDRGIFCPNCGAEMEGEE